MTRVRKIGYLLLFALLGCGPRIYRYDLSSQIIGINDSLTIAWAAKGRVLLKIHDSTPPFLPGPPVPPISLLVSRDGRTDTLRLTAPDTLLLRLPATGRVSIRKVPDADSSRRYRYMQLVVYKNNKDSTRESQVGIFPNTAIDTIGFLLGIKGDSLVASGVYGNARWGNDYRLLAVSDDMGRELTVTHAGITVLLHPNDAPSGAFSGAPVTGAWNIRAAINPIERKYADSIPVALRLTVLLKHN